MLTVAEEQGLRGAKAFDASALRSECGFVLDHASAGRRGDRQLADPAEDPRRVHRGRGPRRHPPRGRQQRDRRRRGGDLPDGAGTPRRADDRQRRPDLRRHLRQRRPRPLRDPSPRPAASTLPAPPRSPGQIADACAWGASEHGCDVDVRVEELFRGYRVPPSSPALALAEAGLRGAGLRAASGPRPAAAATPTRCASTASTASCSPTAPRRTTPPTRRSRARNLDAMLEVCEGIVARRRQRARRERPARAAAGRGRRCGAADGRGRRRAPRRPGPTRCCWVRCTRATRSSSTSLRSTSGLGSGGFDVVHVNLTRGLGGGGGAATST